MNTSKTAHSHDKPFPRNCWACGRLEVRRATIPYDAEVKHDGRTYNFRVPAMHVNRCSACGEVTFGTVADEEISQALRSHLGLLSPREIRAGIKSLGLTQKKFGQLAGIAPETVSRWIRGTHIQSRAMDNLMRMFFSFENVRTALCGPEATGRGVGQEFAVQKATLAIGSFSVSADQRLQPSRPGPIPAGKLAGMAEDERMVATFHELPLGSWQSEVWNTDLNVNGLVSPGTAEFSLGTAA